MGILDWIGLQRKESRATRAIIGTDAGRPVWMGDKYRDLAVDGYQRNVWVNRGIGLLASSAGGVTWQLYDQQTDGKRLPVEDIPANRYKPGVGQALKVLRRPNDFQSFSAFVEACFGFWHVAGNYYIEAVGAGQNEITDPPIELWTQRPDRMKVVPSATDWIAGYVLEGEKGGDPVPFERWQIMHGAFWHPLSDYYGFSPVRAASAAIDQHNSAVAWNVALLQNSARPPGALVIADSLDDPELDRLEKRIGTKYKGPKNAGRPMILSGGLDWKQMGLNPSDMDWLNGMQASMRMIAAILGVPPELLGDGDVKTFANYAEARKAFYEETVLPLLNRFRDELNAWLLPRYGDGLSIDYLRDKIPALQENSDALWTRAIDGFKVGLISRDEGRQLIDHDPVDGAEVFVTDLARPDTMAPAVGKAVELHRVEFKAFALETEEQKAAYWKATAKVRERWAGRIESEVLDTFAAEGEALKAAILDAPGIDSVLGCAAVAIDVKRWAALYLATWTAVGEDFGDRVLNGLKAQAVRLERKGAAAGADGEVLDVFTGLASAYVENIAPVRVSGVTTVTRDAVTAAVSQGIQDGKSARAIADDVAAVHADLAGSRAMTIARTEVQGASSAGGWLMAKATGIPLDKSWLATRDSRTRGEHAAVDGQKVDLAAPFKVGAEGLMFPGDPNGSAGNIINCRCTTTFEPKAPA